MKRTKLKIALTSQLVLGAIALGIIGSGCDSPMSDMADMKNTTAHVADTSDQLNQKTTQVEETSKDLDNKSTDLDKKTDGLLGLSTDLDTLTNSLYLKERQGASLEVRKDMLKAMNAATTMEAKIMYASGYFMGFEYQVWGGSKDDDRALLDSFYDCAMEEFFRISTQYMPEDYPYNTKIDPTKSDPTNSEDNKYMNMYALAVTMHMVNGLAVDQVVDPDLPGLEKPQQVSMYTLIKAGLRNKAPRDAGTMKESQLKPWEKEVLKDRDWQAFEYMIRVRENFLPVMLLSRISKLGLQGATLIPHLLHFGDLRKFWTLDFARSWTADLSDIGVDQMIEYTQWLDDPQGRGAFDARDTLEELGVDPSINPDILKIYKKMKIDDSNVKPADKMTDSSIVGTPLEDFKKAIADLISGN